MHTSRRGIYTHISCGSTKVDVCVYMYVCVCSYVIRNLLLVKNSAQLVTVTGSAMNTHTHTHTHRTHVLFTKVDDNHDASIDQDEFHRYMRKDHAEDEDPHAKVHIRAHDHIDRR
jgi:hypothetical protein